MKKTLSSLLLFFQIIALANNASINQLIKERKYADAWDLIEKTKVDSTAENIIYKSEFCLSYFSKTRFHQEFTFENLPDSLSLLELRLQAPSTATQFSVFNPEKSLKWARAKFPENKKIEFALGTYYYDVYFTYHSEWIKSQEELMSLFYYHFLEADKANIRTAQSAYAISLYEQSKRSYFKAKKYLMQALELDSTLAAANYNLAYSYLTEDSTEIAIDYAIKAYNYYQLKHLKADAASMAGILLCDQKKYEDAINWLLISDALKPGKIRVYQTLLKAYLFLKKKAESELIAKNLYYYDWKSAQVFNGMLESYNEAKDLPSLRSFLESELKREQHDMEYRGFIYLHLCQIDVMQDRFDLGVGHKNNAKESFGKCYSPDHGVFKVIERLEWTLKQQ